MPEFDVSWIVLVAATLYFVLGALWYGMLRSTWLEGIGQTREEVEQRQKTHGARIYGSQAFASLLMAAAAAWIVEGVGAEGLLEGLLAGVVCGVLAVTAAAGDFLFAGRRIRQFVVDSGYRLVGLTLIGGLVGIFT